MTARPTVGQQGFRFNGNPLERSAPGVPVPLQRLPQRGTRCARIAGGRALFLVSPAFILRVMALLTQDELAEDPCHLVANYELRISRDLSIGTERFVAWYLLSHGVIKILLVNALLKEKLWAYPVSVIVFGAFIGYQVYRVTFTYSPGLIALSIFDGVVIWLIWLEYLALRHQRLPQ